MRQDADHRSFHPPSLDGRIFKSECPPGQPADTIGFHCTEIGGVVTATYSGGGIRRGFIVGTRVGTHLSFRYAELDEEGVTAGGVGQGVIEELPGELLRLVVVLAAETGVPESVEVLVEHAAWGEHPAAV